MAKSKLDEAQAAAKSISDLVRDRALRAIFQHDQQLAATFDTIADGIRTDLRAIGYTTAQVREVLEKHFSKTSAARRQIIEDAIIGAAREARVLPQETFDAIFGKEAAAEGARPFALASAPTKKL